MDHDHFQLANHLFKWLSLHSQDIKNQRISNLNQLDPFFLATTSGFCLVLAFMTTLAFLQSVSGASGTAELWFDQCDPKICYPLGFDTNRKTTIDCLAPAVWDDYTVQLLGMGSGDMGNLLGCNICNAMGDISLIFRLMYTAYNVNIIYCIWLVVWNIPTDEVHHFSEG